jgi:hypothetical protein
MKRPARQSGNGLSEHEVLIKMPLKKSDDRPRCPKCDRILRGIVYCELSARDDRPAYKCSQCERVITDYVINNIDEQTLRYIRSRGPLGFHIHNYKHSVW